MAKQTEVSLDIGNTVEKIKQAIGRHAIIESDNLKLEWRGENFHLTTELGELIEFYNDYSEAAWGFVKELGGTGTVVITETLFK